MSQERHGLREVLLKELKDSCHGTNVSTSIQDAEASRICAEIGAQYRCWSGDGIAKKYKKLFNYRHTPPGIDALFQVEDAQGLLQVECKYGCTTASVISDRKRFYKEVERKFLFAECFIKSNLLKAHHDRVLVFNESAKELVFDALENLRMERQDKHPSIRRYVICGTSDLAECYSMGGNDAQQNH